MGAQKLLTKALAAYNDTSAERMDAIEELMAGQSA